MFVDENGVLVPTPLNAPGGGGGGNPTINFPSYPCSVSTPWYTGGNNFPVGIDNFIGTCSNHDFIMQANSKKSIFLKTDGKVGIGENNSTPNAALDISQLPTSGQRKHLRIYGDEEGSIESTANMHLYADPNYQFQLSFGTQAGNGGSNNIDVLSITPATTNIWNDAIVSGNASVGGYLSATGNFNVNTNKFKVTANNGNTEVGGTLSAAGNFSVNTNKFRVTASNGKTSIGNANGTTNPAQLNVNTTGASGAPVNALDMYDGYTTNITLL